MNVKALQLDGLTRSALPNPAWIRGVVLLLVAVAAYFQTWVELWPYWANKNATYTHGTLIAAVCVWLVWRARTFLRGVAPEPSPPALLAVIALSAAWLLAARANVFIVHAALWPLLALAIVWSGIGWRAASRFVFPLGFLYFAIPVWELLKPPLQVITSTMVGLLAGLFGLTAAVDGPYVTMPSGRIYIALDCSGAHFLSVALAVGVLAGIMRGDRMRTRILILAVAGLLSMMFNWLRILLIVLAYLHPGLKQWLETIGHYTFGWWVFSLDLVVFALVLRLVPTSAAPARPREPATARPPRADGKGGVALAAVAALLLPALTTALPRMDAYPEGVPAPVALPGSAQRIPPDLAWDPHYEGTAWEHRVAYLEADGRVVELYRNEYHEQSQDEELVSRGSVLFDPLTFTVSASTPVRLELAGAPAIEANRVELTDRSGGRWIALYTYTVDGGAVAQSWRVQLLGGLMSMYRRYTAGVLAMATPCTPDCNAAEAELTEAFGGAYRAYRRPPRES